MNAKILMDTPTADSLRYLLEEMATDPYVGCLGGDVNEWIAKYMERIETRREQDMQSTVAYIASGIVGIAFSRPLSDQSPWANISEPNDYWKMGNFYVLKAFRGQGIGKAALRFFLEEKGKVFYFADRRNEASIAVAKASGMIHTHDFMHLTWANKYETISKGIVVKTPATYYQVFTNVLPSVDQILNKRILDSDIYDQ